MAGDLAARGRELAEAVAAGTALLAVCGGYQLLGRFYRDRSGAELPGAGVLPLWTEAGDRRMIGDILLECDLPGAGRRTLAGFENHGGRTYLDEGAEPLGRVASGFGNNGEDGVEGCRVGSALGTYLHGPLLPRNPWLADWLLASGARPPVRRGARARAAPRRAREPGPRGRSRPGTSPRRALRVSRAPAQDRGQVLHSNISADKGLRRLCFYARLDPGRAPSRLRAPRARRGRRPGRRAASG